MKKIIYSLLIISACSQPEKKYKKYPSNIVNVKKGMTKKEVLNLIGSPDNDTSANRWEYVTIPIHFESDTVESINMDGYYGK